MLHLQREVRQFQRMATVTVIWILELLLWSVQQQLRLFEELRVDGIQGYLVEQPILMTSKF